VAAYPEAPAATQKVELSQLMVSTLRVESMSVAVAQVPVYLAA
jgi:hypothetical protein